MKKNLNFHVRTLKEIYSKPASRLLELNVRPFFFLFSGIKTAVVKFVFTGEHFQSVPMTGERDYTQTNELQYIMSYWGNCTGACCLLFDERMNAPMLTSCETSRDTAPAMSMETNNPALPWTRAMKIQMFDSQGRIPPLPLPSLARVAGLH